MQIIYFEGMEEHAKSTRRAKSVTRGRKIANTSSGISDLHLLYNRFCCFLLFLCVEMRGKSVPPLKRATSQCLKSPSGGTNTRVCGSTAHHGE